MLNIYTNQLKQNQVPKAPQVVIYKNDPRNNAKYLSLHPDVVVIDNDPVVETNEYDTSSESNDVVNSYLTFKDTFPSYESESLYIVVPDNVSVDETSYRLQKDSNDGSVYYTVSLNFDDVEGATAYEYRIGISWLQLMV